VPKVLGLLVVAAVIAVGAGVLAPASALRVGSSPLDAARFGNELAAIKSSPPFECYLEARVFNASRGQSQGPTAGGASPQSRSSLAAAIWADERVTQLAIEPFVSAHDPGAMSPSAVSDARGKLADAIYGTLLAALDTQSSATPFSCPAVVIPSNPRRLESGASILATLPSWFQADQTRAEAAALGLIDLLPNRLPESGAALRQWYARHATQFKTTCVSDIEVASATAARSIASKIARGLSFAHAATRYSQDSRTNRKGGAIGCFSPNSPAWSLVVQYVGSTAIGKVAVWPVQGVYVLYSPTKRTPNTFEKVAAAVETQLHAANVQSSGVLAATIRQVTPVSIASWLGSWSVNQVGGQIAPNLAPPAAAVTNPLANTPTG
jgi:hypothetical protein